MGAPECTCKQKTGSQVEFNLQRNFPQLPGDAGGALSCRKAEACGKVQGLW